MTQFVQVDYVRAKVLLDQILVNLNHYAKVGFRGWNWYKYFSSFDNIKTNTVFKMIQADLPRFISGEVKPEDPRVCGMRRNNIGINIFEAMYYDAQADCIDNSMAGAAMIVTLAAERDKPELENLSPRFHADPKLYLTYQPFPNEWADLYSVWNLAFTGREFKDWPMYWAKLLTTSVGCYREIPGMYIFRRGINLLYHIIHEVIYRNIEKQQEPTFDLRMPNFIKSFGTSNRQSAENYINKVQSHEPDLKDKEERARKLTELQEVVNDMKDSPLVFALKGFMSTAFECSIDEFETTLNLFEELVYDTKDLIHKFYDL